MRTTVELPADLMRAAKSHAATRGESLKELFTRAVADEIGGSATRNSSRRVTLPLVTGPGSSKVIVTNDDIAELFNAEDSEKYGNR
ncbi:MAG: hypothetical protein ACRDPW_11365 [Mycobacteriales bacterium]